MNIIIKPTVGRMVWYYRPNRSEIGRAEDQPLAAIVTCVHDGQHVNLAVFSAVGKLKPTLNVQLLQEGDKLESGKDGFAAWMPYQIGKAEKTTAKAEKKPRKGKK